MKLFNAIKIGIAMFLILTLCAVCTVSAVTEDSLSQNLQDQEQLENDQKKIQQDLLNNSGKIEKQMAQKEKLEKEISTIESQVDTLTGQITDYNKSIKAKKKEINTLQQQMEKGCETLRQRLRVIYMAGETSSIEILLGAKDFGDFLDKVYLVGNLAEKESVLINELNEKLEKIGQQKSKLETEKQGVETAQGELYKKIDKLGSVQKECDTLLKKLNIEKNQLEDEAQQKEAEMEALTEEFSKMQREASGAAGGMYQYGDSSVIGSGKRYIWPAPECPVITAYWGDDRNHKGIDFACNGSAYGRPIVSAADGTVVIANATDEWGYGWGYYVMVDHGDGYYTQYAHCSRVAVTPGQQVKQGEILGYIGNTGNSFGAHLHFECWYNGQRYNPEIELF